MQFVPSDLPPPSLPDETGIKRVVPIQPAKEEAARPAQPISFDFKPKEKRRPAPSSPAEAQHAFHERNQEERRKYCRRLHATSVLYDVRVANDRRRKNQRMSDITTAVDEVV